MARRVMTPVTVYSQHLGGRGDFLETLKIESPINYGTPLVHMRQDRGMMFGDVTQGGICDSSNMTHMNVMRSADTQAEATECLRSTADSAARIRLATETAKQTNRIRLATETAKQTNRIRLGAEAAERAAQNGRIAAERIAKNGRLAAKRRISSQRCKMQRAMDNEGTGTQRSYNRRVRAQGLPTVPHCLSRIQNPKLLPVSPYQLLEMCQLAI